MSRWEVRWFQCPLLSSLLLRILISRCHIYPGSFELCLQACNLLAVQKLQNALDLVTVLVEYQHEDILALITPVQPRVIICGFLAKHSVAGGPNGHLIASLRCEDLSGFDREGRENRLE